VLRTALLVCGRHVRRSLPHAYGGARRLAGGMRGTRRAVWLLRPPGVYAPQGDSELLLDALRRAAIPRGARMLDIFTGTGVVALAGAALGATDVHAMDLSHRAAWAARWNARLRRLPVTVHRADFLERASGRFDVVTANPPYLPAPDVPHGRSRRARVWDAGEDGRECLDRVCRSAPRLLVEGGVLLLVQSAICGPDRTVRTLREAGLKTFVIARRTQPFGPVLRSRASWLEDRELIAPGEREEELVVVRADLVAP
jgi:release factor glutamine methyltransferase